MTATDAVESQAAAPSWRPHAVPADAEDWVRDLADELAPTIGFALPGASKTHKPRILVLYGSLRGGSFSRSLAYESARILELLGADVRVFNPSGLPVRDPSVEKTDPKVQELRELMTDVFKNQIDWIPVGGRVHPTQGKTTVVLQVNGGANSFNAVNTLRVLSRWMRMPCSTAQFGVPSLWKEFENGRLKAGDLRGRLVDTIEEFYKFMLVVREQAEFLSDRNSERKAKAEKEKEAAKS